MSEHIDPEHLPSSAPNAGGSDDEGRWPSAPADALPDPDAEDGDAQISRASSSFDTQETSVGGADAVPDTPDDVVEPYAGETDATHRRG